MRTFWGWLMPQSRKSKDKIMHCEMPKVKLIPVIDSKGCGIERKKRIQSLLSQMLLRAVKRGRPSTVQRDEDLENAS